MLLLGGEMVVLLIVDLFVNGVCQFLQLVLFGFFEICQLFIVSGVGQIVVVVIDELGWQIFCIINFYVIDWLLKLGLLFYLVEGGWVWCNYGLCSNDYGQFVFFGMVCYGMSDWFILEGYVEVMCSFKLVGGGVVFNLGNCVVLVSLLVVSSSEGNFGQQVLLVIECNVDLVSLLLLCM